MNKLYICFCGFGLFSVVEIKRYFIFAVIGFWLYLTQKCEGYIFVLSTLIPPDSELSFWGYVSFPRED